MLTAPGDRQSHSLLPAARYPALWQNCRIFDPCEPVPPFGLSFILCRYLAKSKEALAKSPLKGQG